MLYDEKRKLEFEQYYEKLGFKVTVLDDFPYVDNDPAFVKKLEEARAFIKEHGLPDWNK